MTRHRRQAAAWTTKTFGKLAEEAGIEIVGTHDDYDMMCNDFDKALANHNTLGTKLWDLAVTVTEP